MGEQKKVLMVLPHMTGGGAERVAAQLMNRLHERGWDTRFLLTHARQSEVVRTDLKADTPLLLLAEELKPETAAQKLAHMPQRVFSAACGLLFEKRGAFTPAAGGRAAIEWQYHREIRFLRDHMKNEPDLTVIAFLQPAIPIVLLAARGLPNRIVISERADPNRLMKKRYGRKFIEKYYVRADAAVFQTGDAYDVYPACVSKKGTVIPNPLKAGLPAPYRGERNRTVTTFCRISRQKNLPLLLKAFSLLHNDFPAYTLRVIGDAPNAEGEAVLAVLREYIASQGLQDAVSLEPFSANVHESGIKDAMYVNSSDYEGICNAMLEAMAIGMPVVCTDCPIGGAKQTIRNGENGLLVPVGNVPALYRAMKLLIEEPELARRLSENAVALRDALSLEAIAARWEALL